MKRLWIILVLGLITLTSCVQQPQRSKDKANSSQRGNSSSKVANSPKPPTPKLTRTSPPTIHGCVVNATALFIRSGPGKNFSSAGSYSGGDCMDINGRNSEATWLKTAKGWISAYYIDVQGDLSKLPVKSVSTPSLPNAITVKTNTPIPLVSPTKAIKLAPTKQPKRSNCDPAYPDVCIPPFPPDLDCNQINYCSFRVLSPDPHGFDGDGDGWGCERCP